MTNILPTLEELREEVLAIDSAIIELIAKRQSTVRMIGEYKKRNSLPVLDQQREQFLQEYHNQEALKHNLESQLIHQIFQILIEASRKVQK